MPLTPLLSASVSSYAPLQFYTFSGFLVSESSPLPSNMLPSPQVETNFHRAISLSHHCPSLHQSPGKQSSLKMSIPSQTHTLILQNGPPALNILLKFLSFEDHGKKRAGFLKLFLRPAHLNSLKHLATYFNFIEVKLI